MKTENKRWRQFLHAAIREHYLQLRRMMSAMVKTSFTKARTFNNVHFWRLRLFLRRITTVLSRLGLTTVPLNHTVWSFTRHAPDEPTTEALIVEHLYALHLLRRPWQIPI